MTYVERVKAAKGPKEALLLLAEGLDKLAATRRDFEWDSWGQSDWPAPSAVAPALETGTGDSTDVDALARQYAADPDSVCAWCHCFPIILGEPCPRCKNRAAHGPQTEPPMGNVTQTTGPDGGAVFEFPVPSAEKAAARRAFESGTLRLADALGADAGNHDWNDLYTTAGPFWVYQHNRDLVMTYPPAVRRVMVNDVAEDSPKLAYEMSRDVLKEDCGEPDLETGFGALGVSTLTSDKVPRGA